MRCPIETEQNRETLLAYTAGALGRAEAAALKEHVEDCAACREFVTGQQVLWNTLEEWDAPPVSADFNRRLYARIESEVSWWDRLLRPLRPLRIRVAVPLTAAACLALVVGVYLQQPVPIGSGSQPAQVEISHPEQIEHALDDMQLLDEFNTAVRADAGHSEL
jgi:hypothetical protein